MVAPNINSILAQAKAVLRYHGGAFERQMVTAHLSGPTGPNSLSVRSGNLRRSIKTETGINGNTVTLEGYVRNTAPYARIHEFGGTVRPKRAKMLAIPLIRNTKTALGPRNYPGRLFVVRGKRHVFLAESFGKGRQGAGGGTVFDQRPVFMLVPSVYIPPRLNFIREFKITAGQAIEQLQSVFRQINMKGKGPKGGPKV